MRSVTAWAVCVVLSIICASACCQQVAEDWTAVAGAWRWEGELLHSGPGVNVIRVAQPSPATETTIRSTIVPGQASPGAWSAVGVMVYFDSRNYWRLALVQSPTDPERRYPELVEMLEGVWQAQSAPSSMLSGEETGRLQWRYGESYEMQLTLRADRVTGTVSRAGQQVWRKSYPLAGQPRALRGGWPALGATDMTATASAPAVAVTKFAGGRPPLPEGSRPQAVVVCDPGDEARRQVAALIAKAAQDVGLQARVLSAGQAADPHAVEWDAVEVLALPQAEEVPAVLRSVIDAHLRAGGHLLVTGGKPFETWLYDKDGTWLPAAEVLAEVATEQHVVSFDGEQPLRNWRRAGSDMAAGVTVTPDQAPEGARGTAARVAIDRFDGWDTWATDLQQGLIDPEQTVTTIWAKGDANTQHLILEWTEADRSRWIASVPISTQWRRYALPATAFKYWKDSKAEGRGHEGDRLQLHSAANFSFGLATSHAPLKPGPKGYAIADIGVTRSPIPEADEGPMMLESVSPWYKTYEPPGVAALRDLAGAATASVAQARAIACVPRPEGQGYYGGRGGRWMPHLVALDEAGHQLGTVAWSYLSLQPSYYCAMWTCVGLDAATILSTSDITEGTLKQAMLKRSRGVMLVEAGADRAAYWPGQHATLGAEVLNTAREAKHIWLGFDQALQAGAATRAIEGARRELTLQPGERRRVSIPWKAAPLLAHAVVTRMGLTGQAHDTALDAITHPVRSLAESASKVFVQARQGRFWLGDAQWHPHGCNFWPLYVSGSEPSAYSAHWLTPGNYQPLLVQEDIELAQRLGMTSFSVILSAVDQLPPFNDFAARCLAHGIRLNVYLAGAHPAHFDQTLVRELITKGRLADNEAIWAYDIAWEPRWGRQDERTRYDADYRQWITDQYGDIEAAEKVWGGPANQDEGGNPTAPTDAQITQDGPWRAMVAAYRRFVDDYLNAKYLHACSVIRQLDPNHLIGHRVGYGGTGTKGAVPPMAYDPISGAKHLDFISPEGWGLRRDWEQFKSAGFITAYCRYAGNGEPVFWSEYGMNIHPSYSPADIEHQGKIHEWLCRMVVLSEAQGQASWWWPGGYRVNENSDYGIIHPWGKPRAAALALRDHAQKVCAPRTFADRRNTITIDRDTYVDGLAGAWEEFGERYAGLVTPGVGVDIVTEGTGRDTANVPLRAVGGGSYAGVGPVQFVNGQFNWIEVKVADGDWVRVQDASIHAAAGQQVSIRASLGNTGDVTWLAGGDTGQVRLKVSTPAGRAGVPIAADCPRYGDVRAGPVVIQAPTLASGELVLSLAIEGRLQQFGELARVNIELN